MKQVPRSKFPLAAMLAVAGSCVMPQIGMAQIRQPDNVGLGGVDEGIRPYVAASNLNPIGTGDDGSSRDATGQTTPLNAVNPYAPQSGQGTTPIYNGDGDPADNSPLRRETAYDRVSRNYGAVRSDGDLTSAAFGNDERNSVRGKTTLRPRRLGVFQSRTDDDRPLVIKPYIEAGQVAQGEISPNNDVLTYTAAAVGLDAIINGRNNQGMVSLRYERRFGWGRAASSNSVTGIAHLSSSIVPDTLRIDYGGYAGQTNILSNGAAISANSDALTQVYSAYAGPTLTTHAGDVAVTGHYHIGYTKIGSPNNVVVPAGQSQTDVFDHSTVHNAKLAAGVRPGEVMPIGLGVEGGYYQEDVSNLAQRVKDAHVRAEVTIPVVDDVALVGGLGYEKTQISSHDALRDTKGQPVVDGAGRLVTDYTSPRYIAFDSDGLIWDAGVVYRPSRRTNMEIHVGRRYGEVGAYGFITYQPDGRSNLNFIAYNNIAGFGGELTNSLFNMPSQFSAVRDAITGNLTSCVSSDQSGGCLAGALGSVNSTVYRGRGVSLSYGLELNRIRTGIGIGYDRRQYIAAIQTVLAKLNGTVDQYYWAGAFVGANLSDRATFETTLDGYHFQSGLGSAGDLNSVRAVGLYTYYFTRNLTGSASLAIDGITRKQLDDVWTASGSVGMRYTF